MVLSVVQVVRERKRWLGLMLAVVRGKSKKTRVVALAAYIMNNGFPASTGHQRELVPPQLYHADALTDGSLITG